MNIQVNPRPFLAQQLSPARIFIFSFAALILIGAIFLWLPFSAGKGSISFVDALFTSASAVCVTGLTVVGFASRKSNVFRPYRSDADSLHLIIMLHKHL